MAKSSLKFNSVSGQFDLVTSELNANEVVNVPSGNLAATNAQAALNELQSDIDTRELAANKGIANGYVPLNGASKIDVTYLPAALMSYRGLWNSSTNTPTLSDGTGTQGHVYLVSVGGTRDLGSGSLTYQVGDWVVHNGTIWQQSPSGDDVLTVFGRLGNVVATNGDYTASQVTNVPSGNLAAVTVQAALDELQSDIDTRATSTALTNHINQASDAHDASAISNVPSGNLAATTVQAALDELQGDINTINGASGKVTKNGDSGPFTFGTTNFASFTALFNNTTHTVFDSGGLDTSQVDGRNRLPRSTTSSRTSTETGAIRYSTVRGTFEGVNANNGYSRLTPGYSPISLSPLANNAQIDNAATNDPMQLYIVTASTVGAILSTTPFTTTPIDGTVIVLMGGNGNALTIRSIDITNGCILGATATLGFYDTLTLIYVAALQRFVEQTRSINT